MPSGFCNPSHCTLSGMHCYCHCEEQQRRSNLPPKADPPLADNLRMIDYFV